MSDPFLILYRIGDNGPEVLIKEGETELIRKRSITEIVKGHEELSAILRAYAIACDKIDQAGQQGLVAYHGIQDLKYTG